MMFPTGRALGWCALLLLLAAGCIPTRDGLQEEQRDPHFLQGQELRKAREFRSAAAAFEQAVAANPRAALAHFELGLLHELSLNDPASAIYHFERFLKLQPTSDRAEVVRQHVSNCKMELAKQFLIAPGTPSVQKELDKLKTEVERLSLENHQLRRQLEVFTAMTTNRGSAGPVAPPILPRAAGPTSPVKSLTVGVPPPSSAAVANSSSKPVKSSNTSGARTHVIKAGDTPATIARQHGLKLEALEAANPGMNPKRLKIGQSLVLP